VYFQFKKTLPELFGKYGLDMMRFNAKDMSGGAGENR
jgi:hypothetical protein